MPITVKDLRAVLDTLPGSATVLNIDSHYSDEHVQTFNRALLCVYREGDEHGNPKLSISRYIDPVAGSRILIMAEDEKLGVELEFV